MTKPRTDIEFYPLPYRKDASIYFLALAELGQRVWLDSGKPWSNYGRYDILSAAPQQTFIDPPRATLEEAIRQTHYSVDSKEMPFPLPFIGGLLGYFNYEYNHHAYQLSAATKHAKETVPSVFGLFHWSLIQDHDLHKACLVFLPECSKKLREEIKTLLTSTSSLNEAQHLNEAAQSSGKHFQVAPLNQDLAQHRYLSTIEEIKQLIIAGDTYQINFSQRFSGNFSGREDMAYLSLRQVLPSPFCAFLELHEQSILSLSPERFIQVQNRQALTQPIKGTVARGQTLLEDKKLAELLKASEKNRAENLMIVDLLRNDFSQCCEPHTVKTPSLFKLESFPNVHHLVSTITGTLKSEVTTLEFFLACFPGGSITGAPKKRSMEIIQALEEHPRNIYCGSVLYLSAHGALDSNIAIRTLLINREKIYCWGGGGIVYDSNAQEEYLESLQKINILIETLEQHTSAAATTSQTLSGSSKNSIN